MIKEEQTHLCPRCGDNNKDYLSGNPEIVKLSAQEKDFIQELYADHLCVPCLKQLKTKFQINNYSRLI